LKERRAAAECHQHSSGKEEEGKGESCLKVKEIEKK